MSVDPTEPESFTSEDEPGEIDIETPEADAAEQHTELVPHADTPPTGIDLDGVDPADAVEQSRSVELDEDEYR